MSMMQIVKMHYQFKFDHVQRFSSYFEEHFAEETKALEQQAETLGGETFDGDDERINVEFNLIDERYELDTVFVQLFRRSVVVMIHGYLEAMLDGVARLIANAHVPDMEPSDVAGRGMQRSLTYLTKVCGVRIDPNGHAWIELEKLTLLRNLIVHADGVILRARAPGKMGNIVEHTAGLGERSGELVIEAEYIRSMLTNLGKAVDEVMSAVVTPRNDLGIGL